MHDIMSIYEFFIRLSMIEGKKLTRVKKLNYQQAETVDHVYQLNQLGFSKTQQNDFYTADKKVLQKTMAWLSDKDHHLITYHNPLYPPLLKQIKNAPLMLFVLGDPHLLQSPQVAMVGSRQFSEYGAEWGRYFASELAGNGLTITSGLALGIDAICHRGALEVSGKTIAVLGSGLMQISPRNHYQLALDILNNHGAIVSEFLPNEVARPEYFPRRNRLISGLSVATLIVEASQKSGSLITARYALEQNRDVFAIPGDISNENYAGTHWLIQQGAYLVTKPTDVLEQLNGGLHWLPDYDPIVEKGANQQQEHLSTECLANKNVKLNESAFPHPDILAMIHHQPIHVDQIAEQLEQSVSSVMIKLLDLELVGAIKTVTGGYIRNKLCK